MPPKHVTLGNVDFLRFRAVAVDHFLRGENHIETYVDMMSIYGAICPELDTVFRWHKQFQDEKELIHLVSPSGLLRICGLGTELEKLINQDRHISLRRLADTVNHDKKVIKRIIREETQFHQDERYVFYVNDYDSMWIKDGEKIPKRARRMISDPKVLLTVFWSGEQIAFTYWTMSGATMTSTRFTNKVLRPLAKLSKKEIQNEKGKVKIHMDNALFHIAKCTKNFLAKSPFTQIRHLEYSHDLATRTQGNRCRSFEIIQIFRLKKALDGWERRTKTVIRTSGAYL
ncbi:MAG: hypothetical protein EZS28_020460 [Streblomastix strix]|uniref:Mariner transposase n=1 Tax=Streblomastix strix TaxID=222440 RepID=A0A5J4VN11_9EUKA|nr:MAG: hypothetical protein EZS28_020460 [Streblomastix strix]